MGDVNIYEGNYKNGNLDGKGIHIMTNENKNIYFRFECQFKNGKAKYGTIYDKNNNKIYEGGLKRYLPNGKGIKFEGEYKYEGNFKDGKLNGIGNIYDKNNNKIYEGEFKNGNFNGLGILNINNKKYEGIFINNELIKGKLYYKDNIYEGEFHDLKKEGKGILYYKNEIIYIGEFKNDYFHGNGIFYFNDMIKYKGEMKNGEIDGKGTFYFATKYEREFKITWKELISKINKKNI